MDNLKIIICGFKNGLFDSIYFAIYVITSIVKQQNNPQSSKVLQRFLKCCLLGGLLILSMILFTSFLKLLKLIIFSLFKTTNIGIWSFLETFLSTIFSALWVLPLTFISRIVTSLWFQDIADLSFKGKPQGFGNFSNYIADCVFSVFIQFLFLIQGNLFYLFPIGFVGQLLSILHTSLLYSLYSFEYKWFNMGWVLYRRLNYIEKMWPYFLGFGLPLALIVHSLPNYYLTIACFAILFPLFILSANETHLKPNKSDHKLPVFSAVVWIANKVSSFFC